MEKNNMLLVVLITLVIGLSLGYGMRGFRMAPGSNGTHMMSNGEMMGNGSSMDMDDMMTAMNAGLRGKMGDAFDQAFLSEMIVHHQGAVEMAQLALTNAKRQELKDLAVKIISAQNKEIADMKMWQANWK